MSEQDIAGGIDLEAFRQSATKTITLPDGRLCRIRKVGRSELLTRELDGPVVAVPPTGRARGRSIEASDLESPRGIMELVQVVVQLGLDYPKIMPPGKNGALPEHTAPYASVAEFEMFLFSEIMEFSGLRAEVAQAATFPDSGGSGAGASGGSPALEPHAVGRADAPARKVGRGARDRGRRAG